MDDKQQRRIAHNEARFRAANESVTDAVEQFSGDVATYSVMCECAITECDDMIEIEPDAYRHVRSSARWFVIRPDHIIEGAEQLVEDHTSWWIVEKIGAGARVAEREA